MEKIGNAFPRSSPQFIYGTCVYWLSIIAAIICTGGPVIAIAFPHRNHMNPYYLFYSIWEGKAAKTVWQDVGGGFAGGHFWLNSLTTGDGFIQLGLELGCCCACVGLIGASVAYLRYKPRAYGWALVSVGIALVIVLSALGIYHV